MRLRTTTKEGRHLLGELRAGDMVYWRQHRYIVVRRMCRAGYLYLLRDEPRRYFHLDGMFDLTAITPRRKRVAGEAGGNAFPSRAGS